jgi:EmrB/QacA subfamily drug resistance transporter
MHALTARQQRLTLLAVSLALLVAARVLQGAGAALVAPATLAIISAGFPEDVRGKAVGTWAAAGALGFAVGPVAGGLLAEHVHWSWVFWANVPVGLAALLVARTGVVESRDAGAGRRIDLAGVATSSAGLVALTYALVDANRAGWRSPTILGLFAVAAVAFVAFALHERHAAEPMLDVSLFRARAFTGGNVVLLLAGFGLFGVFFFLSLYLQGVLGLSAVQGGLAFMPMAAVLLVGAPLSTSIAARFGAAPVVDAGMLLFGVGLFLIAGAGVGSHYVDVLPGLVVAAFGSSLTTPLTTAVISAVPVEKAGVAAAVLNTSRELAGSLGIAVLGAVLAARETHALAGGATAPAAFVSGYALALTVGAITMVGGAVVALVALRPAGAGAGHPGGCLSRPHPGRRRAGRRAPAPYHRPRRRPMPVDDFPDRTARLAAAGTFPPEAALDDAAAAGDGNAAKDATSAHARPRGGSPGPVGHDLVEHTPIRLDPDLARRLDARAAADGTSASDVVRRALHAYLDGA